MYTVQLSKNCIKYSSRTLPGEQRVRGVLCVLCVKPSCSCVLNQLPSENLRGRYAAQYAQAVFGVVPSAAGAPVSVDIHAPDGGQVGGGSWWQPRMRT